MLVDESRDLGRRLRRWGWLGVLAGAGWLPLSYFLAHFSPLQHPSPAEQAMLRRLAAAVPGLPEAAAARLGDWLTGASILAAPSVRAGAIAAPTALATVAGLAALRLVLLQRDRIDRQVLDQLTRFGLGFAVLSLPALPVFTTDFWLSAAWGRMIAAGANPYYDRSTPGSLAGLPIADRGELMTYGPLWGLVSAAVAWVGANRVALEFLLFKVVLAGAWIVALLNVRRLAAERSPGDGAAAVVLFGWLPLGIHFGIAEGHNGVVMVALLSCWLVAAIRGPGWAGPPALAASILVKYATAPLALLELVRAVRRGDLRRPSYLASAGLTLAAGAGIFVLFARDLAFFTPAARMRRWLFWTPGTVLADLSGLAGWGVPPRVTTGLVTVALGTWVVILVRHFLRRDTSETLLALALGVLCFVLFVLVGHVWPWYLVWPLPLAAILWRGRAARAVFCLALPAPFLCLYWSLATDWGGRATAGLALYLVAALLFLASPRWLPATPRPAR